KDENSKDENSKDENSKDENSKDENSKDENSKDENSKDYEGMYEYGQGGGAAADGHRDEDSKDWKGEEHGQEGRDAKDEGKKDWESKDEDKKDRDSKDHDKKDWDSKDEDKKDRDSKDRWENKRDFVYYGEAKVDKDARPGRYELKGSCGEGELVVLPRGGVDGGDGGASTGTDRGLATGGASLLGASALGGIVLMRRRRTDGSLV
ncbi:hypothetical protein ACFYPS_20375, partial [Micromonospora sp. NPDC005087]